MAGGVPNAVHVTVGVGAVSCSAAPVAAAAANGIILTLSGSKLAGLLRGSGVAGLVGAAGGFFIRDTRAATACSAALRFRLVCSSAMFVISWLNATAACFLRAAAWSPLLTKGLGVSGLNAGGV